MSRSSTQRLGVAPGSRRPLVVLVSGVAWDGVKGSERQLAESLGRRLDVLWVDHPVSPLTPRRHLGIDSTGRSWRTRADHVAPGVVRLRPVVLPLHSRRGVRQTTWPIVRARIRAVLRRTGRHPAAVVAASFDDVLGRWGHAVNILYGTDDWVAAADLMRQPVERLQREERASLDRADLVLAVSPELATRWAARGADPVVFANGCDPAAFESVGRVDGAALPGTMPPVVAGLVGQLTDRIDIGYLEAVADTGIGLLLVGPLDLRWQPERAKALVGRPTVHHTGPVPFTDLPSWLARMDVGLVPYVDSLFNRASFPLKSLEYLASGLPVVSTDLPAVRRLRADATDIRVERDRQGFADAVRAMGCAAHDSLSTERRRDIARHHSWDRQAERLIVLLQEKGADMSGIAATTSPRRSRVE